jgi:hypothetical protein
MGACALGTSTMASAARTRQCETGGGQAKAVRSAVRSQPARLHTPARRCVVSVVHVREVLSG